MVQDSRTSRSPRSGNARFESGDSGTAKDVFSVRDTIRLSLEMIVISYGADATANTSIEIHDEPSGTAVGDLDDPEFDVRISPGDTVAIERVTLDDFTNDVVATSSNNDGKVEVTVGAFELEG